MWRRKQKGVKMGREADYESRSGRNDNECMWSEREYG